MRLRLRSGEVWTLAHDGGARLSLAPSVYLEKSRPRPVPTQQVVLSGRAMAYATLVRWSLVSSGDAGTALRDLRNGEDDPA
ncbi:putative Heparinase II/III [Limimaricola hongkongensis DSM 17492]|uniref:Putative Heparinase II/III n=1 Tax=Limimaricola hongkongensis DSM 17492 TaxID=1122180 RepID=A0A017HFU1_9RHOB|nr:putative Heparinase II/III [Limimaricola hongkongensis DSM 17492]